MTDKHIPTFLNPTPDTDTFWKKAAQEKLAEMHPAVRKVLREQEQASR